MDVDSRDAELGGDLVRKNLKSKANGYKKTQEKNWNTCWALCTIKVKTKIDNDHAVLDSRKCFETLQWIRYQGLWAAAQEAWQATVFTKVRRSGALANRDFKTKYDGLVKSGAKPIDVLKLLIN